jgi:putative oxidoreductase
MVFELFAGFLAAGVALWFLGPRSSFFSRLDRLSSPSSVFSGLGTGGRIRMFLENYFVREGLLQNIGLLLLRLAIGAMMIHHGQDKLSDPQQFADTYVASLHLPFPLFFAYAAGFSELIGSWLLIFGLFTPLGALAITGTMAVAGYQHILTSGLNIYVLELVVLYLAASLAILLVGPGRFSFDGAIVSELMTEPTNNKNFGKLVPEPVVSRL